MRTLLPDAAAPGHDELDVTDASAVAAAVTNADVVVHLAALTNVDGCERDPDLAHKVNVDGTRNVVDAARRTEARLVYVSTDYVFDGRAERPYVETDPVNPVNVYGATKLAGERLVGEVSGSLIVRTSWVFGDGRNFVATILAAGRAGRELRIVADQRGIPTPATGVAAAIAFALANDLEGLIHVAGEGPIVSWSQFARAALETAAIDTPVEDVTTEEYARDAERPIAPRPVFSALDIRKARSLGVPLLDWRDGLRDYVGAA